MNLIQKLYRKEKRKRLEKTLGPIAAYYGTFDEDNRLLSRRGQVEFLTTLRYVEKYLQDGMRILEIGAATGRYSHYFAQKGYAVDAVELVQSNIEHFQKKTLPNETVTIRQGNAMNLSFFPDNTFDITLLLGPLYHLYTFEDQKQALSEAIRVTKTGGVIFAAYCMADAVLILHGFGGGEIRKFIARGKVDTETFSCHSGKKDIFQLIRKEEIDALREAFPVKQLHYVATDGCTNLIRHAVDQMNPADFECYLNYHFITCERLDMSGISDHTLDIFQKI